MSGTNDANCKTTGMPSLIGRPCRAMIVEECAAFMPIRVVNKEEGGVPDAPPAQFPVASIEMLDWTVRLVNAALIRFLDAPCVGGDR